MSADIVILFGDNPELMWAVTIDGELRTGTGELNPKMTYDLPIHKLRSALLIEFADLGVVDEVHYLFLQHGGV